MYGVHKIPIYMIVVPENMGSLSRHRSLTDKTPVNDKIVDDSPYDWVARIRIAAGISSEKGMYRLMMFVADIDSMGERAKF